MMKLHVLIILIVICIVFSAAAAVAVTYRNDGTSSVVIKDKSGGPYLLKPAETKATYYYIDLTADGYENIVKTDDAPFAKMALAADEVTGSVGGESVDIDLDANFIIMRVISGTVNIFSQSTSNTPAILTDFTADNGAFQMKADGKFDQLVVTGTGTCRITQYKIDEF